MQFFCFAFCLIFFSLEAKEFLWSGKRISLVQQDGLLALEMNRAAAIEELFNEEKIELEKTVGKMQTVFEKIFGFGDFTRWMPLNEEGIRAYLIPAGAYVGLSEINAELKVQIMLFALKGKSFPSLSPIQIEKIQAAAAEVLASDPPPPNTIEAVAKLPQWYNLKEGTFSYTKTREAFLLLQEHLDETQVWSDSQKASLCFSTECSSFCDPKVIAKQIVYPSCFHTILYKTLPYTEHQLLVIPNRHVATLSELTPEEILDKWNLFAQIKSIVQESFNYPELGVMTRIGWRAGQTQAHLHDHVIPFDPLASQPWIKNWAQELSGDQSSDSAWKRNRRIWRNLYNL